MLGWASSPTLPHWVVEDPFPEVVEAMVKEAELDEEADPSARLQEVVACIGAAAKRVARLCRALAEANQQEWQAHRLALARAACARRCRRGFADAIARIPMHAHACDGDALRVLSEAA